jgi:hypothetical protein
LLLPCGAAHGIEDFRRFVWSWIYGHG